jgi:hypothetical protein
MRAGLPTLTLETKVRSFKLLGERVMARDFDRQVAELQMSAAIFQSLRTARHTDNDACGINQSGVWGRLTEI